MSSDEGLDRAEHHLVMRWARGVRAAQPAPAAAPAEVPAPAPAPAPAPEVLPPENESPEAKRARLRNKRKREVRAHTVSMRRFSRTELRVLGREYPEQPGVDYHRPKVRSECVGGERPCPFVSCTYNLYLDVHRRTGAIKLNFPDLEVWELAESCALDVAERGGLPDSGEGEGQTLEQVGAILNVTRERVRQIEAKALARLEKLRAELDADDLDDEARWRRIRILIQRQHDESADGDEDEDDEKQAG